MSNTYHLCNTLPKFVLTQHDFPLRVTFFSFATTANKCSCRATPLQVGRPSRWVSDTLQLRKVLLKLMVLCVILLLRAAQLGVDKANVLKQA
jgi:hypothetical protein